MESYSLDKCMNRSPKKFNPCSWNFVIYKINFLFEHRKLTSQINLLYEGNSSSKIWTWDYPELNNLSAFLSIFVRWTLCNSRLISCLNTWILTRRSRFRRSSTSNPFRNRWNLSISRSWFIELFNFYCRINFIFEYNTTCNPFYTIKLLSKWNSTSKIWHWDYPEVNNLSVLLSILVHWILWNSGISFFILFPWG